MDNVMIDVETMDSGSFSAITSIGAVKFDNEKVDEDNAFFANVKLQSCLDLGMTISGDTVQWWMQQGDEARCGMFLEASSLESVLISLDIWLTGNKSTPNKDLKVWGNGTTFDNVILSNAFKATKWERPWSYKGDRCYRTLAALYPEIKLERVGVYHNAKDDAITQARHLIKIAKKSGIKL